MAYQLALGRSPTLAEKEASQKAANRLAVELNAEADETIGEGVERLNAALKKPLKKYDTFAVVASEPLASLVSCTLRGADPDGLGESMFCCCEDHLVEVIQTNGSAKQRNGHSHPIPVATSNTSEESS